ncbi:uncharacterized protein LOC114267012 [Camellia sinensis]|uniref:uncharacterized protein LOC114267012 n=1 Tax=Camellia sinensis TaxID=4442 RepID=UPI0010369024|nr:uncharacterized protein LOC114267012 [Camellia sinensis]
MEIQEAFHNILNPNFRDPQLTVWSCLIVGKLKLNMDGSSKEDPGQSGYKELLRDELGTWRTNHYHAKGLTNIDIESDSQTAMELILDGAEMNSPYRALIEDANFLLGRCQCSITSIPRETNSCADDLANLGVNQQELTIFLDDPPNSICPLLITDMRNISSSRD